jgi:cytochrome b561
MIERLRAWARTHSENRRYTPVGMAFHWIMAALVLFQLGWGWWMSRLPTGAEKLAGYQVHSNIGLAILVLALFRAGWRTIIPGPVNDADIPGIQATLAKLTHGLFYLCFFGLPLSGWAMWSALGEAEPLMLAGLVPWPQMPFETLSREWQWWILDWAEGTHKMLVLLLASLTVLHVAAALKHHFWDHHDVLEGMLPDIPDAQETPAGKQHKPRPNLSARSGLTHRWVAA